MTGPGVPLPYTAADRRLACLIADVVRFQPWRADHTETSHLTDYETTVWGVLAEMALARHLGVRFAYATLGSEPHADLVAPGGRLRYEVRSTPWIARRVWDAGQWRTFVYPREVTCPGLVVARVDTFLAGCTIWLTGWLWAAEAAAWPLDRGRHLTRHAVPGPGPLHPPATIPREEAPRCGSASMTRSSATARPTA